MTSPELDLIDRFYAAFDRGDGQTMADCYAPESTFADPVFTDLRGDQPGAMWRMLTGRSKGLSVQLVDRAVTTDTGSARWVARYTFGPTGRPVVNDVRSTFRFADGLIADQRDDFGFARWARQAMGAPGLLLGWTPLLRNRVRHTARASLESFMAGEVKD